jgi:TP901 family phage tail tape measure protein
MADETISTRIVANADFSALIADVHKVTASLSRLQEQLAGSNKMLANQIAVMNRSFSDTMRSTGQYSTHFVSLQSDVEKFGKNLDGGKLKLNQYFNAFRDQARTSGGLIRDLAKQQVSLQNAVLQPLGKNAQGLMQFNVHVPRGLDTIKHKTAIARTELQIMNKVIQDGAGQLINWGKNTQWAGRQLTVGLTVPLAAFGKAAADAFRQADAELVRLTKVYGDVAGSSSAELGKVREDVIRTSREISAAMGVSFKETIGLAADIAATGKTGDELLGSIQETTRLAVLGEVDRQEAMKATLAIQSAFKQNTDELSQSINFLNAVENQTSTTLNDLVEAIPKAGPVIQGLGGSVQDLALYMTAMREGGINASEGANALKSALASLINPTDVAVGKFKTLGIDLLGIVNNNAGNLTGTLMSLQGALDSLDPLQKQQAIEQLFGKFQFSRLNALFENLGRQGSQTLQVLDLMKASTDELAAVAGRELTAVTESASGRYNRALESLKASLASVGEEFLTINTYIIQTIDKVIQFATNLPKPVKQILTLLGGITAIAGPLIMITGLLANFFGYMAKGIFHLKAFFKGGEGFKYLTPEMLAAEKAASLVEQSFYSDAKAAAVLKQALGNLIDEFSVLEAKAKAGAMSVNPAVSTMAGNLVMAAGSGRVVDPSHPLVGAMGSRASSHMVPRAGMTEEQRLQQTIFGMVPGSGPVNQKIGQNPQIYMNENLPNVPGLTTIGGVSTGIVAEEAARHHAMMATLAMQSKEEINEMKKQMVATGTISKDLMVQFDGMLPVVSSLTDNAAKQSAMIVAELRAGLLNVEQARAKIIALNLETERMIAAAASAQAGTLGRTINPTMVPTLNQPVVDPTGKSNMRELFKKGNTRDFINKVAGALGVRTSGAGYNIETTRPRRLNSGGYVYTMNDGNIVPGPNVNADVVPAMLTPGEFVVNAESTRQNLPLLQAINGSPREAGRNNILGGFMSSRAANAVLRSFGVRSRSQKSARILGNWGMVLPNALNRSLFYGRAKGSELRRHVANKNNLIDVERFLSFKGVAKKDIDAVQSRISSGIGSSLDDNKQYTDSEFGSLAFSVISPEIKSLESRYPGISLAYQKDRMSPGRRDTASSSSKHGPSPTGVNVPGGRPSSYGSGSDGNVWAHFSDSEFDENIQMLAQGYNSGGMVPGYALGGRVQALTKSMIMKKLGGTFGKSVGKTDYQFSHLSSQIGMGKKLFGKTGLRPNTQNLLYDALLETIGQTPPSGYYKSKDGKLFRGIEPDQVNEMVRSAADIVFMRHGKQISPIDKKILQDQFRNWDLKSIRYTPEIKKAIFGNASGYNKGGRALEMRAMGGPVSGATPYMVGEQGPEIFVPQLSGKIISNKNMGGMVQRLNEGGEVEGKRGMGGTGMFMGGMGLSMAGGMMGGTAGSIMSNVGMAMQFMPMLGMLPKLSSGTKLFSTAIKALTGGIKAAALAMRALVLSNPLLLAGTALVAGLITVFKLWRKEVAETKREQTNLFGITEKGAKEAGIQYESLTDKVKAVREEQKLAADKAKAYFESYNSSGVKGLTLTIQQLRELKERVKNDMPELISTFNSIDTSKVNDLASNLKAQMIAGGKSVEEATNLIYALIEASDKAGMGVSAISTKAFSGITDQGSAAAFVIKNLAQNIKDVSEIDPSAFASNVDSAIASLDAAVNSLIGTKDESGNVLDESEAVALQFEKITAAGIKNNKLGEDALKVLKAQRPEFANILNKSDTIGGMYAKWRLMLQGVSVDLSKIDSAQAEALATFTAGLDAAAAQAIAADGTVTGLEEARGALAELQKAYADAKKRSNTDKIDSAGLNKQKIKEIQNEIKAIRDLAEAKKRALRETFDKENAELELQKAKLDLQSAISRGDNEAAAAAQIRIQQIQKESSLKAAEARIDQNAKKAEAKQQGLLDKDAEYKDALREGALKQGKKAENLQGSMSTISGLAETLGRVAKLQILSSTPTATEQQKADFKVAFANALNDIAKAAKSDPKVLESYGQFLERTDTGKKDKSGNAIFDYKKDAKGNFIPGKMNNAQLYGLPGVLGSVGMGKEGSALTELKQLSKGMSDFAITMMGKGPNNTLADIYRILAAGTYKPGDKMETLKTTRVGGPGAPAASVTTVDAAELTQRGISYMKGTVFQSGNDKYEVTSDAPDRSGTVRVRRKAMGGYITRAANGVSGMTGSQPYLVGERGPELFVPSSGGQIIPNNMLGASYHIPSGGINSIGGSGNNSSSSNTYNIDIQLSGTNVTADDIIRKFKSELALVNAKEGRSRSFGGNY